MRSLDFARDDGEGHFRSTTGIQPVIQTIDTDGTSRYFDLQGRQLTEKPAKGFYIKDGKKYLNK